jgi:hypothetical protein
MGQAPRALLVGANGQAPSAFFVGANGAGPKRARRAFAPAADLVRLQSHISGAVRAVLALGASARASGKTLKLARENPGMTACARSVWPNAIGYVSIIFRNSPALQKDVPCTADGE